MDTERLSRSVWMNDKNVLFGYCQKCQHKINVIELRIKQSMEKPDEEHVIFEACPICNHTTMRGNRDEEINHNRMG